MTSAAISTYQNTPSPSRLTMANARRTPERAPMRLTLRHQPASLASMRLRGGRACMCLAPCEAGEDVVERGCHVVRAQPRHRVARGGAHDEAQVGVAADVARRGDEAVFVVQGDRRAVRSVAQVLAGGAVVERQPRHAAGPRPECCGAAQLPTAPEPGTGGG